MQASTRNARKASWHAIGLSAVTLLLLMTPAARSQKALPARNRLATAKNAWVESTLGKMSLREKLGQMLMPYYFGGFTATESASYKELLHQVKDNHVGGFIIGTTRGPLGIERSQVYPTAVIANELQMHAKVPLLISADFESGTGMRLDEGTNFPSAMAIGATGDPQLAYLAGKDIALEARAAGVHWIFAPDADLNDNPANPIINVRSFGENAQQVSQFVAQSIRGFEAGGALATAKHFPGHGDVGVDSHLSLPVVPDDRQELEGNELLPFRAAIEAGVSSIMPGHLAVPALEPDASVPASLSPKILTGLLREEMRFRGLIVTDAMDMGGVTLLYAPGEAAVRAVEAGADVILQPLVPDAALEGLESAVKSSRISEKRIDESVRRILQAKAKLGLAKNRLVDIQRLNEKFGLPKFENDSQEIADRGVTLLRNGDGMVPLNATRPLHVLLISLSAEPDAYPGAVLESEIRWRVDSLKALRADTQFVNVSALKPPAPETYDITIVGLFVRVADRKGNVGMPEDQRAFVTQLLASGKPIVIMGFGSPYVIANFPAAKTWIGEFSSNDVSQRAAVRALFGQVAFSGHIPVTVPNTVKRGDGIGVAANAMTLQAAPAALTDGLAPAFALIDRAIADGAFPGGVLAVGVKNQLVVRAFGKLTRDGKTVVGVETIYDVASLTKPIVTTTCVMILVQQKRLDLDAPLSRFLPEWNAAAKNDPDPTWRAHVTPRMLLLHDSGLPAHRDFYRSVKGHEGVVSLVMAEALIHKPGTQVEYSDLGFILLGEIVERLTGKSLTEVAREEIFAPLGMKHSLFNPPRSLRASIPPTENDQSYRKRLVQGEVHDQNAWAMGGIAGDAGLFSTASDVSIFAQMILNGGIYEHHRVVSRAIVTEFTARQVIGNSARTLGWDVPLDANATGRYFSAHSFGHYGFTGTSLWIDSDRELFIVLLTNRVNPSVDNLKIRQVRPALHDAVYEALGLTGSATSKR